jgi:nitroreductase
VEAARFAPTGTNKQDVKIVMVTDAAILDTLREKIMTRYGQYERHLSCPVKRFFLKILVDRRLGDPGIRDYLRGFMDRFRAGGDPLFHRAPAAAFLFTGEEATTGKDDCVLALYHMVLMAERLGLGSCLLGTVEAAFSKTPALNDLLGVPRGRPLLASACFGYPAVKFQRLADRRDGDVTWL